MIFKFSELIKRLGPKWVLWRLVYSLKLCTGLLKRATPIKPWGDIPTPGIKGNFFSKSMAVDIAISAADAIRSGRFPFFFHHSFDMGFPPDWFSNPFEGESFDNLKTTHWSKISDFGQSDIKCIWELSRFAWVYPLLQAFQVSGDGAYCEAFWKLVENWAGLNPPNAGVHWKCGQEITVRMFALVTGYFGFQNAEPSTPKRKHLFSRILHESAQRIEANIGYALQQHNNHGVSEAAGLFTAGILFNNANWIQKGAQHLEDQINELVYNDGSFSQHSVNYHRVMLHACLWAIQLGRANGFEFSDSFMERIREAGKWLLTLYDPQTGRMPNLGANDGALVLPYSTCEYFDFRPTIQAVGSVIDGQKWLPSGEWNYLAECLGAKAKAQNLVSRDQEAESRIDNTQVRYFSDGGYAVFSRGTTKLIFRCPKQFRHRPAQCDLLHVDLWYNGVNLLRDAGTYSYNCEEPWQSYFKSTMAHNTIQFDEHDQMPKISRFLYGKWPTLNVQFDDRASYVTAGFTDWKGCLHQRNIKLEGKMLEVKDRISCFKEKAVLRWRLAPELRWALVDDTCIANSVSLDVKASSISSIRLTDGWESLYYWEKTRVPVLEIAVGPNCKEVVTHFHLN